MNKGNGGQRGYSSTAERTGAMETREDLCPRSNRWYFNIKSVQLLRPDSEQLYVTLTTTTHMHTHTHTHVHTHTHTHAHLVIDHIK